MKVLQYLSGARSAILLIIAVVETITRGLGFEAGPAFSAVYALLGQLGWDTTATGTIADPAIIGASLLALFAAGARLKHWWKYRNANKA